MGKITNLRASITNDHAPLTVGFVLDGPTIADRKRWNFDNGKKYECNDLIFTTTYWKPGNYNAWVDLIDDKGNVIESGQKYKISITVTEKLENVTLDQWQGVIYEDDVVGFSISTSIPGEPKITWEWGDEISPPPDDPKPRYDKLNPWHTYKKNANPWKGTVTVEGSGIKESRSFGVLVLPNPVKTIKGYIDVKSKHYPNGSEVFTKNEDLTLAAQVSGGKEPKHVVWHIKNYDGTIENPAGNIGKVTTHHFSKSGNYTVECVVTDDAGLRVTLLKDVIIRYDV